MVAVSARKEDKKSLILKGYAERNEVMNSKYLGRIDIQNTLIAILN